MKGLGFISTSFVYLQSALQPGSHDYSEFFIINNFHGSFERTGNVSSLANKITGTHNFPGLLVLFVCLRMFQRIELIFLIQRLKNLKFLCIESISPFIIRSRGAWSPDRVTLLGVRVFSRVSRCLPTVLIRETSVCYYRHVLSSFGHPSNVLFSPGLRNCELIINSLS